MTQVLLTVRAFDYRMTNDIGHTQFFKEQEPTSALGLKEKVCQRVLQFLRVWYKAVSTQVLMLFHNPSDTGFDDLNTSLNKLLSRLRG